MCAQKIKQKETNHSHHTAHHTHHGEEDEILQLLREEGYRVTAPRRSIIEALATAASPKTAKQIGGRTKIKDASTVYRTLEELKKLGVIEEFQSKGVAYFEIVHDHHDHAICEVCGKIEHIPCEAMKAPRTLTRAGWTITSHEALYRGVCGTCAAK